MTESDVARIVAREVRKQMQIILSGETANAKTFVEDIQALFPGMAGITGRPVMHPYGFASLAPDGTIQVTARQGDHCGNRMVLGHRAADRPTDLEEGEVCLYSSATFRVVVKQGAVMIGKGNTLEPAVMGTTLNTLLTQLLNAIIAHTHAAPGTPPTNIADFETLLTGTVEANKILAETGGKF